MTATESPQRREQRTRTMWLIGSVALLHGAMIGIYYLLHIQTRPDKTQQTFIAVWVVMTLAVVLPQMKKIRALRRPRR